MQDLSGVWSLADDSGDFAAPMVVPGDGIDAIEHALKLTRLGAGELLVTSMDRDGTRDGYDLELIRTIADQVDIPVVASGGVGHIGHLVEGVTQGHASAVLAASIFHFGDFTIAQAKAHMAAAGIPMMPVVAGEKSTRRQIFFYALIMAAAAIAPWPLGYTGALYGWTAVVLSAVFVALSVQVGNLLTQQLAGLL